MRYYRDIEIIAYPYNPYIKNKPTPIRKSYTIVFEDEDENMKAEDHLRRLYGWSKGVHYDHLEITTMKEHGIKQGLSVKDKIDYGFPEQEPNTSPSYANKIFNKQNKSEMAKQAPKATQEVAVFEEKAKQVTLPEIPDKMVIGGIEVSEEKIREVVKAVKELKVETPKQDDTVAVAEEKKKVYEDLVEKKNQFVKTRTSSDKFRKDLTDPLTKWSKELKAKTDAFGNAAKEGEEHCKSQIYIWENWEAEQLRIKQEATQKIVDTRTTELQSVQGMINRDSLHWTFAYLPSKIVEPTFLEDADDSEWNGLMKELEDAFKAEQQKVEQEKKALIDAQQAVYNARVQILNLMQYEASGDTFTKNGHVVTQEQIKSLTDAEWMPFLASHNAPKENVNPFARKESVQESAKPAGFSGSPFGGTTTPFGNETIVASEEEIVENVDTSVHLDEPLFHDSPIGKGSTARLYRTSNQAEATEGLTAKLQTSFENGLSVIIY